MAKCRLLACALSCALGLLCSSTPASAQNWSADARRIALGGVGTLDNPATEMIDAERPYHSIVIPLGLIQVFGNTSVFDPSSSQFDPVRAIELAVSPVHFVIGREDSAGELQFINDIRNATLNRDLNAYRGFTPPNNLLAEGLASPNWGGTIKLVKGAGGSFQGIYIGAGPYLSMHTAAVFPQGLTDIWASPTAIPVPGLASYTMTDDTLGQVALAVTGGYRARYALSGIQGGPRDGVYVAVNYNYLRGFRYENEHMGVRLDTDPFGRLFVNPLLPSPVIVRRQYATSGNGFAIDAGVGVVVDHWEVGVGARGLANRMDWTGVQQTTYALGDPTKPLGLNLLFNGNASFAGIGPIPIADAHVELPVEYSGNVAYHAPMWTAMADVAQGFQGTTFHAGLEERLKIIELRGGMRYSSDIWNPSGGIGINFFPRLGLDIAAFGTSANLERKRHLAIAASLRINSKR